VVKKLPSARRKASPPVGRDPFSAGALVVVTLGNPRDKFWGTILALASEGLSISGIELASFDDLAVIVKSREAFTPTVVFFPMHRVERIELDLPAGDVPSLAQRFQTKTGREASVVLNSIGGGAEKASAEGHSSSRSHSERRRA
jgi:hypothetical protein